MAKPHFGCETVSITGYGTERVPPGIQLDWRDRGTIGPQSRPKTSLQVTARTESVAGRVIILPLPSYPGKRLLCRHE